jgi:hypothetical protein
MGTDTKTVADRAVQRISTDQLTGQPNTRGLTSEERSAVDKHYNVTTDAHTGQPRVSERK